MRNNFKHLVFWSLYAVFLFVIFNLVTDRKTSIIKTSTIILSQTIVFYLNFKWILPRFYELKKYALYILTNLALVFTGIIISFFITKLTPQHIEHEEEFPHDDMVLDNLEIIVMNAMPIILIIFVSFFLYTFLKRKQQEEKELAIVTAEKSFLIQQTNPHFLFNTLNNIYSLTFDKAPRASKAIMQLSRMLDYSLYGEKEGTVSLNDEITYINNFIDLFKLKDKNISDISFNYSQSNLSQKIAPMLLIPFIENAFKHGNIEDTESNAYIKIELKSITNQIIFNCSNSFVHQKNVDKTGGIGIKNVTRRLELLYPNNKHQLEITNHENDFIVSLKITL
ncbi:MULTISPECIES: sensor histidine kinase [unclassified Tenacibaculum]|uniref:sensor histidine kinase n=1 Tax=unclassified Tenacibaculum TaxID=2635139 RepID=UPI001F2172AF|nr:MULTISPECIES: histidine kinase [unclassified Tenacibaculum]MCF2873165.1 histidine kinase [Tenacibaculum sp. Cn5-1]MCF2933321.1 histidine kinase [Tenacibaculum sp. Cn5-34]MCG7510098.1 histidine kinase [Tenacibaculum sp. Cn5-46]